MRCDPPSLVPLSLCPLGVTGIIRCIQSHGPIRRRLADMGVTRGVDVEVVRVAPLGDPIELKVRGYHLCLRKDEAVQVLVELPIGCCAKRRRWFADSAQWSRRRGKAGE